MSRTAAITLDLAICTLNFEANAFGVLPEILDWSIKSLIFPAARRCFRMETHPTPPNDAEEQWFAKYRRAIDAHTPFPPSRSGPLGKRIASISEGFEKVGKRLKQPPTG